MNNLTARRGLTFTAVAAVSVIGFSPVGAGAEEAVFEPVVYAEVDYSDLCAGVPCITTRAQDEPLPVAAGDTLTYVHHLFTGSNVPLAVESLDVGWGLAEYERGDTNDNGYVDPGEGWVFEHTFAAEPGAQNYPYRFRFTPRYPIDPGIDPANPPYDDVSAWYTADDDSFLSGLTAGLGTVADDPEPETAEVPTGLTATNGSEVSGDPAGVTLSWRPANGAVEYAIWRNGDWYDWVPAPETIYVDTSPVPGARYQLRAKSADGTWSRWTNPVTADGPTGPPPTPTNLTVEATSTGVALTWDGSAAAVEYAIWRDGRWYGWVKAPTTNFTDSDTGIEASGQSTYQIRALGADGSWSGWTERVAVAS